MLGGQTGPFLKKLVVGSESANNVYLEKVDVYNMYAMSESGFAVGIFLMRQCLSRRVHDAVFVGRNNNRITSAVSVMIQKKDYFGTFLLLLHSGDDNNCINFQLLGRQSIW